MGSRPRIAISLGSIDSLPGPSLNGNEANIKKLPLVSRQQKSGAEQHDIFTVPCASAAGTSATSAMSAIRSLSGDKRTKPQ
jgi:hypothetical protein